MPERLRNRHVDFADAATFATGNLLCAGVHGDGKFVEPAVPTLGGYHFRTPAITATTGALITVKNASAETNSMALTSAVFNSHSGCGPAA